MWTVRMQQSFMTKFWVNKKRSKDWSSWYLKEHCAMFALVRHNEWLSSIFCTTKQKTWKSQRKNHPKILKSLCRRVETVNLQKANFIKWKGIETILVKMALIKVSSKSLNLVRKAQKGTLGWSFCFQKKFNQKLIWEIGSI